VPQLFVGFKKAWERIIAEILIDFAVPMKLVRQLKYVSMKLVRGARGSVVG
jgi:hypothetical protein